MTKRTVPYSPEVRERAVRMVFDHQNERGSPWAAIQSVAAKIGRSGEALRNWVRRSERDRGQRTGPSLDERERIKTLEREVRQLRQWVDWFSNRRLLASIGNARPAEAETRHCTQTQAHALAA